MARTERELQAIEQERQQHLQHRARLALQDVKRECPPGYAIDRAHVAELLGQQWTTLKPYRMALHFLCVGLAASGWTDEAIAVATSRVPSDVTAERERSIWWRPSEEFLAQYPVEVRAGLAAIGLHGARDLT